MNRIIEHREFRRDLSTASAYGLGVTLMTKYVLALAMILVSVVLGAQSEEKSLKSLTTYTSDTLGFSYTYPPQLVPNTGDFRRKLDARVKDQVQGVVLFSAFETPIPEKARESVVITAEDAAHYGSNWAAKDCLRKVTIILSRQGWTVLRQNTPAELDGQKSLRSDYEHTNPLMFQSVVCTIRKGSVLEFVFSAGSEEEIDQLYRSVDTIHFQDPTRTTIQP
jgi:hypothetical protein